MKFDPDVLPLICFKIEYKLLVVNVLVVANARHFGSEVTTPANMHDVGFMCDRRVSFMRFSGNHTELGCI